MALIPTRAIRNVFRDRVIHRTNRSVNHHLEQDHRGTKQRYRPTGGLNTFVIAAHICRLFDEVRASLRPQSRHNQRRSLHQRRLHREPFTHLIGIMATA
jgi:putative transposase